MVYHLIKNIQLNNHSILIPIYWLKWIDTLYEAITNTVGFLMFYEKFIFKVMYNSKIFGIVKFYIIIILVKFKFK